MPPKPKWGSKEKSKELQDNNKANREALADNPMGKTPEEATALRDKVQQNIADAARNEQAAMQVAREGGSMQDLVQASQTRTSAYNLLQEADRQVLRSSPTAQAVSSLAIGQIPGSGLVDAGKDFASAYQQAVQGNYMGALGSMAMGAIGAVTELPGVKTIKGIFKGGKAVDKLGDAKKAAELKKLEDAKKAADAKKAKEAQEARQSGPVVEKKKKVKRKPKRRCELVPYDELECEAGQEAHHVVPDWMLRMGKRGGADRIPEMPSLAGGPAICLEGGSGNEHNTAHKHTDRPAQRIGRSGKATGVAGTITLGQGKAISSRAIEKATGGKKGGGCDREDIQKQLDEKFKAQNDALLRGVKDSRKVTDSIKDALNGGKD